MNTLNQPKVVSYAKFVNLKTLKSMVKQNTSEFVEEAKAALEIKKSMLKHEKETGVWLDTDLVVEKYFRAGK